MPVVKETFKPFTFVTVYDDEGNVVESKTFIEGNKSDLIKYKELWIKLKNSKKNFKVVETKNFKSITTITRKENNA